MSNTAASPRCNGALSLSNTAASARCNGALSLSNTEASARCKGALSLWELFQQFAFANEKPLKRLLDRRFRLHRAKALVSMRQTRTFDHELSFLDTRLGFTAIELIAIIAVLGLLASVMVTSFAGTRGGVAAVQCRNNHRQLVAGWRMYTDDNHGTLVYNSDGTQAGLMAANAAWVAGWLDFTSSSQNTNTAMLVDHTLYPYAAYLGPYVKDPALFKCPADRAEVRFGGKSVLRVRSVSLNNYLGVNTRSWNGLPNSTFANLSQIKSPMDMFVVLDERADSINDGLFWTDASTRWQIIDYPGAYHNGAGSFSFADGHVETHRWNDRRTDPILSPGQLLPLNQNLPNDLDILWLQQHAVGQRSSP